MIPHKLSSNGHSSDAYQATGQVVYSWLFIAVVWVQSLWYSIGDMLRKLCITEHFRHYIRIANLTRS